MFLIMVFVKLEPDLIEENHFYPHNIKLHNYYSYLF